MHHHNPKRKTHVDFFHYLTFEIPAGESALSPKHCEAKLPLAETL
jgi:hypothetical protein